MRGPTPGEGAKDPMEIKDEGGESCEGEPMREDVCCRAALDGFFDGVKNPF